jgi:hypothetical protein
MINDDDITDEQLLRCLDQRFMTLVPWGGHEGRKLCEESDQRLAYLANSSASSKPIKIQATALLQERAASRLRSQADELPADDE